MKSLKNYFTKAELALWLCSLALIIISFLLFDRESPFTLMTSLIGVTSLIFCAKGNPIGQVLMIIFSLLYAVISYSFAYYGEMATYLGMSMPMAVISLISWLKNPFQGNKAEVEVNTIKAKEGLILCPVSIAVTIVFYFILKHFNTASLLPSTFSVITSFIAAYLTFRRSPYYALAYAANDLVLIVLWTIAAFSDIKYISVVVCFGAFFANDVYGYISWQKIRSRQSNASETL